MARTNTHRTSQNMECTKTQQTLRNNYFFCFSARSQIRKPLNPSYRAQHPALLGITMKPPQMGKGKEDKGGSGNSPLASWQSHRKYEYQAANSNIPDKSRMEKRVPLRQRLMLGKRINTRAMHALTFLFPGEYLVVW